MGPKTGSRGGAPEVKRRRWGSRTGAPEGEAVRGEQGKAWGGAGQPEAGPPTFVRLQIVYTLLSGSIYNFVRLPSVHTLPVRK